MSDRSGTRSLSSDRNVTRSSTGACRRLRTRKCVFDDQDQRSFLGEDLEQGQHRLEHPRSHHRRVAAGCAGWQLAELRQKYGQFSGQVAGEQRGDLARAAGPDELPEQSRDRCVGQGDRAYFHAAAGKHPGAVARLGRELADQPRLANTGFSADQDRAGRCAGREVKRALEEREFAVTAHENGARLTAGHAIHDASDGHPR